MFLRCAIFLLITAIVGTPARAAEWGYEGGYVNERSTFDRPYKAPKHNDPEPRFDKQEVSPQTETQIPTGGFEGAFEQPKPVVELDATPDKTLPASGETTPDSNSGETAITPVSNPIVRDWLSLLGLVAPIDEHGKLPRGPDYSKILSPGQRQQFAQVLEKLVAAHDSELRSIQTYWGKLSSRMEDDDQRANYRLLFRALLSMRAHAHDVPEEERAIIQEALGPKRIAEAGAKVSLTEDAINAYTDMAMFLYERAHPGKTVDADDNRELYGLMVRDKFVNAPSDRDRKAMNDFPLSWAKFRILYTDADNTEKEILAARIASPEGVKGFRNEMLETVLQAPTWKRFLLATKGGAAPNGASGTKPGVGTTRSGAASRSAPKKSSVTGVKPKAIRAQ